MKLVQGDDIAVLPVEASPMYNQPSTDTKIHKILSQADERRLKNKHLLEVSWSKPTIQDSIFEEMFELALMVPKYVCEITETKILKRRSLSNQNIALAEP